VFSVERSVEKYDSNRHATKTLTELKEKNEKKRRKSKGRRGVKRIETFDQRSGQEFSFY